MHVQYISVLLFFTRTSDVCMHKKACQFSSSKSDTFSFVKSVIFNLFQRFLKFWKVEIFVFTFATFPQRKEVGKASPHCKEDKNRGFAPRVHHSTQAKSCPKIMKICSEPRGDCFFRFSINVTLLSQNFSSIEGRALTLPSNLQWTLSYFLQPGPAYYRKQITCEILFRKSNSVLECWF